MLKSLQEIADLIDSVCLNSDKSIPNIIGITDDSREDCSGKVFVALKGTEADGHCYIEQAFENGAIAAIVENEAALAGKPGVVVNSSRNALSKLASLVAAEPSKDLKIVGITGTNGKTTINWILYEALNKLGSSCIRLGTLGVESKLGVRKEKSLTTLGALELQNSLKEAVDANAQSAVLEVSSHALHQTRVEDVHFDVAIFTNLDTEHLDYHLTLEDYFAAKRRLFYLLEQSCKEGKTAVINLDSEYGRELIEILPQEPFDIISFGEDPRANVRIAKFSETLSGSQLSILYSENTYLIESKYIGAHNASNMAAAFAAMVSLGYAAEEVCSVLNDISVPPGRLECIASSDINVFIDYAHTPNAFKYVLGALKEITDGKLWVFFGCGGDRDRSKRPEMTTMAAKLADHVVLTSDNPRTEDPKQILEDMLSGDCNPALVNLDRAAALHETINEMLPGDVLLITGKGREEYEIIGTEKVFHSDLQEVAKAISNRELKVSNAS